MGEKGRGRALSKERNKSKRGRPRSRSAPAVIMNLPVIKKRKQWTELSMNMAVDSVKKGALRLQEQRWSTEFPAQPCKIEYLEEY